MGDAPTFFMLFCDEYIMNLKYILTQHALMCDLELLNSLLDKYKQRNTNDKIERTVYTLKSAYAV